MEKHLTDFERDQLIEVINIGSGHASDALSKMVEKRAIVNVPDLFVDRVERISQFIGKSDEVVTVVILKLLGDVSGDMFLMFPPESALKLAGLLTKNSKKDIKVLDDMDRSALREVGNILSGAGMTALSNFLDMNILQSVPAAATDMLGSVVDTILAETGQESDTVLVFKVNFKIEEEDIDGQLFFLFNPMVTEKILEATKNKLKNK